MPKITTLRKTSGSRRAVERVIELHDRQAEPQVRSSVGVARTADVSFVGGGAPSGVGTGPVGQSSTIKFEVFTGDNPTPILKAAETIRSSSQVSFAEDEAGGVVVVGAIQYFDPAVLNNAPF